MGNVPIAAAGALFCGRRSGTKSGLQQERHSAQRHLDQPHQITIRPLLIQQQQTRPNATHGHHTCKSKPLAEHDSGLHFLVGVWGGWGRRGCIS